MTTGFLFPGQGSQRPGMLHDLVDHPAVDESLREMSEALGYDVHILDTPEALLSTVSAQLALFAAGVATARALLRSGVQPIAVAGLSVGAFAAAVVAESISLADAVRLVRSRAEQMEKMYPTGYGLTAIVGLNESQVARIVRTVYSEDKPVFVANINGARQIVVSGSIEGMKEVLEQALALGARKAEFLDVPVPSHCPLLQPIADSLHEQLKLMTIDDPKILYVANVNARAVRTAQGVAKDLADNIAHGVRWHDAMGIAQELGCELFLELPPGHVLSDLANENLLNIQAHAITPRNFNRMLQLAKG
jgi:malonate decarboxylase epsilon subunit